MKNLFPYLLLLLPVVCAAQSAPQFTGGENAYVVYMNKHVSFPKYCIDQAIEGVVTVDFDVDKDGSISNARVKTPVEPHLDSAAVAFIKKMPKWVPGKEAGSPAMKKASREVVFRLSNQNLEYARNLAKIEELVSHNDAVGSMSLANQMVTKYPKSYNAHVARAKVYGLRKDYAKACADLEAAKPYDLRTYNSLKDTYCK